MLIFTEKKLNEMAIQMVSAFEDGLPFRITIKAPDHLPPHAHVMDLKTGKTELGQFEISKNPPRIPGDIKDYKQGITNEMRGLILKWANLPNRDLPKNSNWDMLYWLWKRNERR